MSHNNNNSLCVLAPTLCRVLPCLPKGMLKSHRYGFAPFCVLLVVFMGIASGLRSSSLYHIRGRARFSSRAMTTTTSATQGTGPTQRPSVGLVWYKPTDLRLLDHQPLHEAHRENSHVLHAICVDERLFGEARGAGPAPGTLKTGRARAAFMLEGISDLGGRLRSHGSDLVVLLGQPERDIPHLASAYGVSTVYCHSEACSEEIKVQQRLKDNLGKLSSPRPKVKEYFGNYMYHIEDLPFSVKDMPVIFTSFRKPVESRSTIRRPFPVPAFRPQPALVSDLPSTLSLRGSQPPTLHELGFPDGDEEEEARRQLVEEAVKAGAILHYQGGETKALARLEEYFWGLDLPKTYKETRNGMLGPNYSSKFAPWLAQGNISPRVIASEIKRYEKERVANESTYWLMFELLWRDFFRFSVMRFGNAIFKLGGAQKNPDKHPWVRDMRLFRAWVEGMTGVPLIDACMRELKATGFLGNRGRQIVASFLTKDLLLDWRMGAAYFEEVLIDYDPASNWGNWNYVAGVGSDPREDRYFNPVKQAQTYDSQGDFIRYWCPELAQVPADVLHQPWLLTREARKQYAVPDDYPSPVVKVRGPRGGSSSSGGGGKGRQGGRHQQKTGRR